MALVRNIPTNILACCNSVGVKAAVLASSANVGTLTNHKLSFITNDTVRATLDTSGNLGIGTDSPGARLDVRGTAIFNEGGGDYDVRMEGDSDANLFYLDASTDRIGIGTATPAALFHAEGIACVTGNTVIGGDLTVTGDDITLGTNTSGYMLVADGTNYNPVAMSGDVAIDSNGATTIQASSVENSMLAGSIANSKLSNSSVSYGGVSVSLGASDATPAFDLSDATAYPGDTSLVCVGTIAGGTWQGTAIDTAYIGSTLCSKTLCAPVLNGTISGSSFLDEDDFSSDSATSVASQQSIKAYVDAVASGLDLKCSSHVATTANLSANYNNGTSGVGATLTNSGTQEALSIDGETLASSERVLVKDQTAACHNGIYTVTTVGDGSTNWVMTRATDYDTSTEITSGSFTFVETGTTNGDHAFVMTTDGTITVGTTAINWTQFSGAGQITAGAGLTKSGSTINVGAGSNITVNADDVALSTTITGLTALTATTLTGTLATAAQANITSVGTLTSLCSSGDVTVGGDLTVAGDDLTMGTNTSGYLLIADGTNFNPTAVSGDVTIDNSGTTTIGATKVTNAMLAGSIANTKLSNSSVSYGGVSLSLGGSDATPAFDLADATNYPTSSLVGTITNAQLAGSIANDKLSNSTITLSDGSNTTAIALGGTMTFSGTSNEVEVSESSGTLTIGLPSTVSGLTTVSATNLTGTLSTAAQANVTSVGTLTSLTVSGDVTIDTTTLAVDSTNNRVGIGTATPSHLLDVEGVVNVVTCVITPVYCVSGEYALPASDGTTGQVLCTDGSGGLSFATNIPASPGGSDTYVQFNEGGSTFGGSANFTWDDTTVKASNFCTAGTATLATVDINAGAIDGTTIGASSASTIAGTTLTATGNVSFDGGTFVFNESGADKDFRIEGDDEANLFITDASTDRVGIGTATPSHLLDVEGVAHAATCFVSPDVCATTKVVAASLCVGGAFALPTSDGSAGQIICTDGSGALTFASDSTNSPGGNNTNVQFNDSGGFGGSDNLTWDGSTLTVATHVSTTCLTGTLQTAAQANVTSLGTLTALTVSGDVTIDTTTLKVDHTNSRVGVGTATPAALLHVEGVACITGNTTIGCCLTSEGLITAQDDIKTDAIRRYSDSSTTTKIILDDEIVKLYAGHSSDEVVNIQNGSVVIDGDLTVSGDDLTMGTNTSGYILVADGTNYNPVAVSGDVTISAAGAVTIAADAVENSMLANCTVSYGGVSLALGGSDATPAFDLADATNYPTSSLVGTITNAQLAGSIANDKLSNSTITISDGSNTTAISLGGTATFSGTSNEVEVAESSGTVTIGLPSTVSGLTTVSATTLTGTLSTAAQGNVTSLGNLTSLCVSGDTVVGGDLTIAGDDLTMGTNTDGYILVADGTNYNPVAVSGDVTLSNAGAITIAAGAVENSMLANCTVSYGGIQLVLGGSDATPAFDLTDATNYPTSSLVGTITNAQLAGSIANSKLANDSVSFGGVSVDLGASDATPAFDLSDATAYTGDSSLVTVGTISSGTWQGTAIATGYIAGTLTSKTLCDPVLVGTISGDAFLDEDDMASDSASKVASQQSIKAYVDSVASGLDMKCSSHVATTANLSAAYNNGTSGVGATLTNSGTQAALSIDGETLAASERVLVKNQTTACHNGIYSVTTVGDGSTNWVLTRTTDFDSSTEVTSGAFTFVETGSTNGDHGFVMTSDGTITIGTTAINWTQFSGAGQITAGAGMTKSGNTLNVIAGDNITVNADDVALSTTITGVTSISSTCFTGTLQTAAQTNITSVGTLTSLCSSGDVTIGGDLTIAGDDLTMGTNTSGYLLIADGTNYNPVAMSGDVAITSSGATTIQASSVENSMLAGSIANSKLSNSTVSYGGVSLSLGGSDSTPAFDLADATNYPTSSLVGTITNAQLAGSIANAKLANSTITLADGSSNSTAISLGGTMCFKGTSDEVEVAESSGIITIGLPSTVSGLTTVSATTLTGTLSTAVQSNITSLGSLSSLCVTGPVCMGSGISSGSTITATTLCSSGDLVVAGDDITMATNTSGYILVADGTNYNPVAVSGDVTISSAGAVTIAADAVENSMLANCTITVSDGSNTTAIALGGTATFSGTTNEVEVSESSGTLTIGLPSTVSGLTTVSATTLTGTLSTAAQTNVTSVGTLSSLCISGTLDVGGNVSLNGGTFIFNESGADKDFRIEGDSEANLFITDASVDRVGIGTATPSHLLDIEGVGHAATCFVSADLCATTKVVGAALCVGGAYALPASDGSAGEILCTDGSGAIAFAEAASSGHTIAEDGSTFTARTCLNFTGTAVAVTDCSSTNSTDVAIQATGACMPIRVTGGTQCYACLASSVIGGCLQCDSSPTLGGNLDVNGNSIVSASNGNIPITPNGSGKVIVDGICHPTADGSAGQVLCTDGSAALQWATIASTSPGGSSGQIQFNNSSAFGGSANLTWDNTNVHLGIGTATFPTDQSGYSTIQMGPQSALVWQPTSTAAGNSETIIGNNVYLSGGSWKHAFADEASYIYQNSGTMRFYTAASASAGDAFNGDTRMIIAADGQIGIGTTAPEGTLNVFTASAGSVTPDTDADDLVIENSGDVGIQLISPDANYSRIWFNHPSGGSAQIRYSNSTQSMHFKAGSNEPLNIDSSGRVGIGTATMAQKLDVYAADAGLPVMTMCNTSGCGRGLFVSAGCACSNHYLMRVSSNVGDSILLFTGDGNLGIGTTAPISGNGIPSLDIYKANGTCRVTLTPCVLAFCNTGYCAAGGMLGGIAFGGGDSAGNGNTYACIFGCINSATNDSEVGAVRMGIMNVHNVCCIMSWYPICAVAHACVAIVQCLCVQNCIGAPVKNFEIEHPLASDESPNKYNQQRLIHSTLEGPEYGVYYRGTGQLSNGAAQIDLPEYFEALADKESATIQFTPVFGLSHLTIKSNDDCAVISNNKFCVCTDDNGNQNQCFHWFVQGRRIDKHTLYTIAQGDRPGAYDDGRLCVERWRYREELVDNLEGLESMTCAELDDFINFNNTWDSDDPVFLSDYENVSKANKIVMIGNAVDSVQRPLSEIE